MLRAQSCTHDIVVLAAHDAGRARVAAAHTDDGERRAVEPDEKVRVLQDYTEQPQEGGARGRARLSVKVQSRVVVSDVPRCCSQESDSGP